MNSAEQPRRPIMVGVDGSEVSLAAVRWAAAEASARECPLRLIQVYSPAFTSPAAVTPPYDWLPEQLHEEAEELVDQAVDAARTAAPGVAVTGEVVIGRPGRTLAKLADDSEMTVLGNRGRGGFASLMLGSVTYHVAGHSAAPVVVVRGSPAPDGPVVVGVDGSAPARAALEFGIEEAELRQAPLTAIHAWAPPPPPRRPEQRHAPGELAQAQRDELRRWVEEVRDKHPHVVVQHRLVTGQPAAALITAGQDAGLLVVGSRGRGGIAGMLLGSVSHQVIHHASGATAVIR